MEITPYISLSDALLTLSFVGLPFAPSCFLSIACLLASCISTWRVPSSCYLSIIMASRVFCALNTSSQFPGLSKGKLTSLPGTKIRCKTATADSNTQKYGSSRCIKFNVCFVREGEHAITRHSTVEEH